MNGLSLRCSGTDGLAIARQKKMVHPTDPNDRIADTCGHARAKERRQDNVRIIADGLLTLDNMKRPGFLAPNDTRPLNQIASIMIHCRAPNTASIFFFSSGVDTGFLR